MRFCDRTMPPASRASPVFFTITHGLRRGLEESRQLRWLGSPARISQKAFHAIAPGRVLCGYSRSPAEAATAEAQGVDAASSFSFARNLWVFSKGRSRLTL